VAQSFGFALAQSFEFPLAAGGLMATLVLGLGTSHTPMLSTPWEQWALGAERDKANPRLLGRDGEFYRYDQLLERADSRIAAEELTEEKWRTRHAAAQAALARVGEVLAEASPDALVIVGDDQGELFPEEQMPALSIYWGESIGGFRPDPALLHPAMVHPSLDVAAWGWYGDRQTIYPCDAALGRHLIEALIAEGFDVSSCRAPSEGRSIGHAYGFYEQRIMRNGRIPIVPIFLNGYFPPNQPTAARSYALGRAIRRAIEAWDSDKRVAFAASGGLSHLVISEELDHQVIGALQEKDERTLTSIPERMLRSGSGEIKNWIAAAGALEHLDMHLVDYVPAYRSPAGTGVGMAFTYWS
jgi:3-O-methylgallate 3,4-dioxygenase